VNRLRKFLLCGHTYALHINRKKAEALTKYFDVTVATRHLDWTLDLGGEALDFEEQANEPLTYELVRFQHRPRGSARYRGYLAGFLSWLRGRQFDYIHVEAEPWAPLRWQAWWGSHLLKGRFSEFSWENVERRGVKGVVLAQIYRAASRCGRRVICGNSAARRIWLKHGKDEASILVAPQLGVDEVFSPVDEKTKKALRAEFGLQPGVFLVGFVGRFVLEKGVLDLVEAVKSLRSQGEEIEIALAGNGPLDAELRKQAEADKGIHLLKVVRHREVARYLQCFDLLVLPSKRVRNVDWEEQFGHVLVEAMACGVPAIGSDCGAIPEVLEDPGRLFPQGDIQALSKLILRIKLDPEFRYRLKETGQRIVAQKHTHAAIASSYYKFLACEENKTQPGK
jgi:glycosyltransferase involved in cell wall biosynthesis